MSRCLAQGSQPVACHIVQEARFQFSNEARTAIDKPGIKLQQRGARLDFGEGGFRAVNAADADKRDTAASKAEHFTQHRSGAGKNRSAGQPACLCTFAIGFQPLA